MAKYDHGGGCSCGLSKVCDCGHDANSGGGGGGGSGETIMSSKKSSVRTDAERHSVAVLRECIELQNSKGADYQSKKSTIKQADYYTTGCLTIWEIMHAKMLRMRSIMEASLNDPSHKVNHESIEDSAKDLANYASFMVSYARGRMEGQDPDRDFLNRPKK